MQRMLFTLQLGIKGGWSACIVQLKICSWGGCMSEQGVLARELILLYLFSILSLIA